jgi:hypothetical protein
MRSLRSATLACAAVAAIAGVTGTPPAAEAQLAICYRVPNPPRYCFEDMSRASARATDETRSTALPGEASRLSGWITREFWISGAD